MVKIAAGRPAEAKQIFSVYTEERWQTEKDNFPQSVQNFFNAKKNDLFVHIDGDIVRYLIGVGNENVNNFELQQVGNKFAQSQKKNLQAAKTVLDTNLGKEPSRAFLEGLFLGTYHYPFSQNHPFWKDGFTIYADESLETEILAKEITALCNGQFAAMDWLNKPANEKTAPVYKAYLENLCKEKNLKFTSFNRQECLQKGLGAFAAVNQGSADDAAFIIIEYSGNASGKTIGLVGKSIVFDTGGISLKNPENMHYMKSDMGGGTAVLGFLITACEQKLPVNIVAIFPVTDNAISQKAYLPSDVVKAYNRVTIEVLNTDAEGRLALADGLAYLTKNYETDVILDLATLTGSAVRMFGDTCGALFSNDENLKQQLISAADQCNQRLWPMPLWEVWEDDIKSEVADLRNISLKPVGDCIVAAKFLQHFIGGHKSWAHMDIAGVAFGNANYAKEKSATGYGVQLLLNFVKNLI